MIDRSSPVSIDVVSINYAYRFFTRVKSILYICERLRAYSSAVERSAHNGLVIGSNPVGPTILFILPSL